LVDDYKQHLTKAAGLRPATTERWMFWARQFLCRQFGKTGGSIVLSRLMPLTVLHYFLEKAREYSPGQLQSMASGLRSFFRFLWGSSRSALDLSQGIPSVATGGREHLPDYLSGDQLRQVLRVAKEDETPVGLRDHALMLCLAKLALRAGEVARLKLDDVNWHQGVLILAQTKGRRERQLPLPEEVGKALVRYLRHGRPVTAHRHLFVSSWRAVPMSADGVSRVTRKMIGRAGLKPQGQAGAHLFRRTAASHLVQRGVSIKEVADLLGHGSLKTTMAYAQVNLPMLRELARPWPTRRETR
jgi:site-specific recombinase XerD